LKIQLNVLIAESMPMSCPQMES